MAKLLMRRLGRRLSSWNYNLSFQPKKNINKYYSVFSLSKQIPKSFNDYSCSNLVSRFIPVCSMCSTTQVSVIDNYTVKLNEEENEHFHRFLEESSNYRDYLLTSFSPDSENESKVKQKTDHLSEFKTFLLVGSKEEKDQLLNDENFHSILDKWSESATMLSDSELFHDLKLFSSLNFRLGLSKSLRNVRLSLASACNEEFLRRLSMWNVKKSLIAVDLFYHLRCNLVPNFKFIDQVFLKLERSLTNLSKEEIILTLFYANLRRKCSYHFLNKLTKTMLNNLDSCTPEEVGIICLGNFKCKNLKTTAFHSVVTRYLIENVEQMDSMNMSAVSKFLNSASHDGFFRYLEDSQKELLLTKLGEKAYDWKYLTFLHVMSMCERWRCITPQLVSHLAHFISDGNISNMRLKDLAKASMLIGNLSPVMENPVEILEIIIKELLSENRSRELSAHLHNLSLALDGMTRAGVYPKDLFLRLFDEDACEYFNAFKLNYQENLARLLERVKIECKELQKDITFVKTNDDTDTTTRKKIRLSNARIDFTKDLTTVLNTMLGDGYLKESRLFSHDNPDIEVRLSQDNGPLPNTKWNTDDNMTCQRILFVLQSTKDFYKVFHSEAVVNYQLKGFSNMKLRQLRKLKYIPIPLVQYEFYTSKSREEYIKQQVKQYLPNQQMFTSEREYTAAVR